MRTVPRTLLALWLLWNVGAFARQPTPFLPDPELTPGDVFDVTVEDICRPGYSNKVRAVTKALRDQAYRNYGIASHEPGDYQLDHLIPLSIGGSNSIRNLCPQPNTTSAWTRALKTRLRDDCSGLFAPANSTSKPRSAISRLTGPRPTRHTLVVGRSRSRASLCSRTRAKTRFGSTLGPANTGSPDHSFSAKPSRVSS